MALTARQAAFVEQYLVDLNATQAAIRAGYSAATAQEQGSRLLSNVMVAGAVAAGKAKLSEHTGITKAWLVSKIADGFRAAAVEKHYAGMGRLGELLAKLHGFITEKREVRVIRSIEDLNDEELAMIVREDAGKGVKH